MNTLYILSGVPGSGKSTFLKKNNCHPVISRDAVRFSMLGESDEYFSKENEVFERFIFEIVAAMAHVGGFNDGEVYVDATHLNPRGRAKLLNAIENQFKDFRNDWDIVPIVFDVPFEVCLKRNAQREGRAFVPEDAMKNMYNSFKFPTKEEGFDMYLKVDEYGNYKEIGLE